MPQSPDNPKPDEDRLPTTALMIELANRTAAIKDAECQQMVEGIFNWLKEYAVHGGKVPLDEVLDDLRVHSKYGKYLAKKQEGRKRNEDKS